MLPALDPRLLEAFSAVVSTGGITAAAGLLGRSQPTVSRQVQELEAAVGFGLLARSGRGVVPTEAGALFFEEVERHLAALQRLGDRARVIRGGGTPSLEVAAVPAFAAGLLTEAIARLPGIEETAIHLRAAGGQEVVELVRDRVSDLGLCSLPLPGAGFDVHWAIEGDCVAVLRADDPLARRPVVPLAALAGRRLITTANPFRQRRHVDEALREAGVSRLTPLDTNTSFGAMGAVRAGLGVALIEPLTPAGAPVDGLVVRALDVSLPFRYGAITRAGRRLAPAAQALLALVPAVVRERVPTLRDVPLDEMASRPEPAEAEA